MLLGDRQVAQVAEDGGSLGRHFANRPLFAVIETHLMLDKDRADHLAADE